MSSKEFKKMMANKMGKITYKGHHCHGFRQTKEGAHEVFKARRDKQALPDHPKPVKKDREYKNMAFKEFIKKYPEWKL